MIVPDFGDLRHVFLEQLRITRRRHFAENLLREWPNETPIRVVASGEQGRGSEILCELTREELIARVAQFASVLRTRGISAGDRVVLILPVGIDALVTTLGALSVGAVISSVAPEFGAPAILDRIDQLDPLVVVAAIGYDWNGRHFDRIENIGETIDGLQACTTFFSPRHLQMVRMPTSFELPCKNLRDQMLP